MNASGFFIFKAENYAFYDRMILGNIMSIVHGAEGWDW